MPPSRSRSRRTERAAAPGATESAALAGRIGHLLQAHVIAARRNFLAGGYAPTNLTWLGVPVPAIRRVVRDIAAELQTQPPAVVLRLALALAREPAIEGRQVGYELIGGRADVLALITPAGATRLGRGNDNWASVDAFATSVTGPAWRCGSLHDRDLLVWARSADPWWRRVALVSTVALNTSSRGGHGDSRRTLLICRAVLPAMTPMLAKALSWALRSLAPHDPVGVLAFVDRHRTRLPAHVIREVETKVRTGTKH